MVVLQLVCCRVQTRTSYFSFTWTCFVHKHCPVEPPHTRTFLAPVLIKFFEYYRVSPKNVDFLCPPIFRHQCQQRGNSLTPATSLLSQSLTSFCGLIGHSSWLTLCCLKPSREPLANDIFLSFVRRTSWSSRTDEKGKHP